MFTKEHIGRTVYDCINVKNGIGKIISFDYTSNYPIKVKFTNGAIFVYTKNGEYTKDSACPTLSFTPYTLQGYTNEIPRSLPEYFEKILVSNDNINWVEKFFNAKIDDNIITADTDNVLIAKNETFKYYKRFKEIE